MHADDYACEAFMSFCGELCAFGGIYELLSGFMRVSKILCVVGDDFLANP